MKKPLMADMKALELAETYVDQIDIDDVERKLMAQDLAVLINATIEAFFEAPYYAFDLDKEQA